MRIARPPSVLGPQLQRVVSPLQGKGTKARQPGGKETARATQSSQQVTLLSLRHQLCLYQKAVLTNYNKVSNECPFLSLNTPVSPNSTHEHLSPAAGGHSSHRFPEVSVASLQHRSYLMGVQLYYIDAKLTVRKEKWVPIIINSPHWFLSSRSSLLMQTA